MQSALGDINVQVEQQSHDEALNSKAGKGKETRSSNMLIQMEQMFEPDQELLT